MNIDKILLYVLIKTDKFVVIIDFIDTIDQFVKYTDRQNNN